MEIVRSYLTRNVNWSKFRGLVLVFVALATLIIYLFWWVFFALPTSRWLALGLAAALFYCIPQLIGNWLLYLATHRKVPRPELTASQHTVDVFVTAYGEPLELIKDTLCAAQQMNGNHQVWLLDDKNDEKLAQLAATLGTEYLARQGNKDAKAGNVNAALACTNGSIIVVFDIDHSPKPQFLNQTVAYFNDPAVGFVQTMLTFANEDDGWVARAASESSYDFYSPASIGANGLGAATLVGSNALIRRTALEDIGGYKPGLAEDLATSIALHANGWESRYVHEVLAPGYAPPDFNAWFTQQLKWARGVFELLVTDYPTYFKKLKFGQMLSYLVRMTYYWLGLIISVHLAVTTIVVLFGNVTSRALFEQYLLFSMPLCVMTLLIRLLALRRWRHSTLSSSGSTTIQWRPVVLVYNTWPVYTVAWLMALLRIPLEFQPTPKSESNQIRLVWLLPQLLSIGFLIAGTGYSFFSNQPLYFFTLCAIAIQIGVQLIFVGFVISSASKSLNSKQIDAKASLRRSTPSI